MADEVPTMAARRRFSGMTADQIFDVLNESELELSDDDDPIFVLPTPHFNNPDGNSSSSTCSNDESEGSHGQSDVSLSSSFTQNPRRSRGRSRATRRNLRGRSRIIRQTRVDIDDGWVGDFAPQEKPLFQPRYKKEECETWSCDDFFNKYIDNDILEKMVDATNRTYIEKKGRELRLTANELKTFIGMQFVMSAIDLPKIRMYWSRKYGIPVVKNAMTRTRFFSIRSSLKVVYDNEVLDEQRRNKIWKVLPLFNTVLHGCHSQIKSDNISVDEMIIPFSAHCGIRQYCPGKPNPVGIKIFVLANPNGLVCDMTVYQGDTTYTDLRAQGFTLGEAAILSLCESLVPGHHIYCDRYFTTIKLADTLLKKGFHVTGTISRNRIPRNCLFSSEKEFMKKPRGTAETKTRNDGTIAMTRWLDNKPVIVVSTQHAAISPDQCRRWSKRKREYEIVSHPEAIKMYNQYMGGVDMADRMLAVCPARARTRKWTIRFISHMLDLAVCNAWFQFRDVQRKKNIPTKDIPQLRDFKLNLGEEMIVKNTISSDSDTCSDYEDLDPRHSKRRVEIKPIPVKTLRQHKAEHLLDYADKLNRCRKTDCKYVTTAFCIKCEIFLCSTKKRNCFLKFHKND